MDLFSRADVIFCICFVVKWPRSCVCLSPHESPPLPMFCILPGFLFLSSSPSIIRKLFYWAFPVVILSILNKGKICPWEIVGEFAFLLIYILFSQEFKLEWKTYSSLIFLHDNNPTKWVGWEISNPISHCQESYPISHMYLEPQILLSGLLTEVISKKSSQSHWGRGSLPFNFNDTFLLF